MAGVRFTRESAGRIAAGIRAVESQQQGSVHARPEGYSGQTPFDYALIGKTDAAHNQGADGTISIWSGATSATLSDTGDNITAYNRFGNIASGKWVKVFTYPWGFEVEAAQC